MRTRYPAAWWFLLAGASCAPPPAAVECSFDTECPVFSRCVEHRCVGADGGVQAGSITETPVAPRYRAVVDAGVPDADASRPDADAGTDATAGSDGGAPSPAEA